MKNTLQSHISNLESRIQALKEQLNSLESISDRDRIQFEIQLVDLALAHYRAGFELERRLYPLDSKGHFTK
jgi:hypothetical protein